jgi:hypothetical protein
MTNETGSGADFDSVVAPQLIAQLPGSWTQEKLRSRLFSYFGDADRLAIVVGDQVNDVDWALVYGLSESGKRRLHLVLPSDRAFATRQRAPWLTDSARPVIWLHANGYIERAGERSRRDTVDAVNQWAKERSNGSGPKAELAQASTPAYLGRAGARITALVEWATADPQLDASHVSGTRSWHCVGQKVLSIEHGHGTLRICAGIHDGRRAKNPDLVLTADESLTELELSELIAGVEAGMQARLAPTGVYHKPDEHWLQSVLRRNPSLVGVETPALREVPAWRPAGTDGHFGRGYLDLLGLDGQGDIRLVEAKLAKSTDDQTLLQGLDYHVWATAYRTAIADKLSAPRKAQLRLHYAIGTVGGDKRLLPPRIAKYANALDTRAVPYQFHRVSGWHTQTSDKRSSLEAKPSPDCTIPTIEGR